MKATIQGYAGSQLDIDARGITFWLPWAVFGKCWQDIASTIKEAIGHRQVITWHQREMTARGKGQDAPRWIGNPLDALSWLLFLLKVPASHELVRLWQVIDWAAINRIGGEVYRNARGGRLAWAPAQLVAMLALMFLYGIPHETMLVARLSENIVWCWFCGFSLFGPFPKHDALYELRKRMGVERFERALTLVVEACLEAGLIENELINIDPTPLIASAHRWSPYERAVILTRALIRYLEQTWAEQPNDNPDGSTSFPETLKTLAAQVALELLPHKGLQEVQAERVLSSVAQWEANAADSNPVWKQASDAAAVSIRMAEELAALDDQPPQLPVPGVAEEASSSETGKRLRQWLVTIGQKALAQMPHARGDPNARVGRTTSYTWFCGYLLAFAVDAFRQVITAVAWQSGNVRQAKMLEPAMDAHIDRVGKPDGAAADSAFDDPEVYAYLDEKGIVGHITSREHVRPKDGGYGTDCVTWPGTTEDVTAPPLCPGQQPLTPKGKPQQGRQLYEGAACVGCPIYKRCHPSGDGQPKQFSLQPEAHRRWQENRTHCQTDEYKSARRERFISEGRFGLLKLNHNRARAPYRSDEMNHVAGLMMAIVMDYRILARYQPCVEQMN